jgi:hypothetical protein
MGMLDRYKKKGGYIQLLQLLETSGPSKREQFFSLIAAESSEWEASLKKHVLTINRVFSWEGQYLFEILTRVPPLMLASVLFGKSSEDVDQILFCLPPISKRKITDLMSETNPTPFEQSSAIFKMLAEVRGLFARGVLRMEKVDPGLVVPDNIEETLSSSSYSTDSRLSSAEIEVVSKSEVKTKVSGHSGDYAELQHEIDTLWRKLHQSSAEINSLRQENGILKDKLAQIKKIA